MENVATLLEQSNVVFLCLKNLKDEQFDRRQMILAKKEYEKQIDTRLKNVLDLRSI